MDTYDLFGSAIGMIVLIAIVLAILRLVHGSNFEPQDWPLSDSPKSHASELMMGCVGWLMLLVVLCLIAGTLRACGQS